MIEFHNLNFIFSEKLSDSVNFIDIFHFLLRELEAFKIFSGMQLEGIVLFFFNKLNAYVNIFLTLE